MYLHGAQQLNGLRGADHGGGGLAVGHRGQEGGLDVGRLVHPGRHAVRQQAKERILLLFGRRLEKLHELGGLGGVQGLGDNAHLGALRNVGIVCGWVCEL
jgi:hypothetical protein